MLGKKGMEISINVIVMIILGIVMFGAAMAIFGNLFTKTVNITEGVNDQMRERLMERFPSNELVFLPETNKAPQRRLFRTDNQVKFYVGVYNNNDNRRTFKFDIKPTGTSNLTENNLLYTDNITIGPKDRDIHFFIVNIEGVERGQQGIIINVTTDDDQHGNPRIAYVDLR